jgi:AraC-like DNA-binding protein
VDEGCYLTLEEGRDYDMEIDSALPVETLCFFFQPGFVEGVLSAMRSDADGLLEPPKPGRLAVRERLDPIGLLLRRYLDRRTNPSTLSDDDFVEAAELLLRDQSEACYEPYRLELAREAARTEIHRRLEIARDSMLAHLAEHSLESAAAEAGLSPYHFHRLFRTAFGKTPHEFVTEQRMLRAARLLAKTKLDLVEVCDEVGFQSVSSFSRLFRRHTGLTPGAFRKIGQVEAFGRR